jgi:hypothetical protein
VGMKYLFTCTLLTCGLQLALAVPAGSRLGSSGVLVTGDGSTETANAIQTAVDALPATGGVIRLRARTYLLARGSPT